MSALEVITVAPGSSVQDLGRFGLRRYGISVAGAMDHASLVLANALVGNAPGNAGLEIPYSRAAFRVREGPVLLAATGPGVFLRVDGRPFGENRSVLAASGAVIAVERGRSGVFAYLAVAGGIQYPPELGSRSLHLRSGIGGRPLRVGDRIPCKAARPGAVERLLSTPRTPGFGPLRVVSGPQADHFTPRTRGSFLTSEYRIANNSDRMGIRLDGPCLAHARGHNILSDGVLPGSVQVPGDGRPIVLMRDCQTTGGYPKIATVISADLDRLAQTRPGDAVTFADVTVQSAIEAARTAARDLNALCSAIFPVGSATDSRHLLSHNLIGGAVHGGED